jgi:hypothetical protein
MVNPPTWARISPNLALGWQSHGGQPFQVESANAADKLFLRMIFGPKSLQLFVILR